MQKVCTKCKESKSLDDFINQRNGKYGKSSQCKKCRYEYTQNWAKSNPNKKKNLRKEYRERNREKIREMDRQYYREDPERYREKARKAQKKYFNTEKGRKKYYEYYKKDREKYPERYRARSLLSNAIVDGKIIKPTSCQECKVGNVMIEAHHPDYSKPYDVMWLCTICHGKVHQKIKHCRERLSDEDSKE